MSRTINYEGWIFIALAALVPIAVYVAPYYFELYLSPRHGPGDLMVISAVVFLYFAALAFAPPWLGAILIWTAVVALVVALVFGAFAWWAVAIIGFGPGFGPAI